MIALTDVATKLEEILNSEDCPTEFSFVVKSQGYHLDSIADKKKGKNLIPVFLTMVGGEYNPVPNLKQANFTYGVDIWFPVRFKEIFYNINEYLENTFVGKKLNIGGKVALCNIGVAEYGEIVGLHLDQFEEWVEDTYVGSVHLFKKEHDISEEYMNMHFNIYATVLGDGFMFGNDVKYNLSAIFPVYETRATRIKVKYEVSGLTPVLFEFTRDSDYDEGIFYAWKVGSVRIYTTTIKASDFNENLVFYNKLVNDDFSENPFYTLVKVLLTEDVKVGEDSYSEQLVWDSSGTGASISPISQQLIGKDKFVKNIANITNFNKSIVAYPKNTSLWNALLYCYNNQILDEIKNIKFTKTYTIGGVEKTYEFNQIVLSLNENVELGSPLSFTIAFGDGE